MKYKATKVLNNTELIHYACRELFENKNLEIIKDVFAQSYVTHTANKDYEGYDFIRKWFKQLQKAIPTIDVNKIEILWEDNDTIVWQRSLSGKHTTLMWGVKPSNKIIEWKEMIVSRFENGKIIEEWVVSELKGELLVKRPTKISD